MLDSLKFQGCLTRGGMVRTMFELFLINTSVCAPLSLQVKFRDLSLLSVSRQAMGRFVTATSYELKWQSRYNDSNAAPAWAECLT